MNMPTFKRGRCRRGIVAVLAAAGARGATTADIAYELYKDRPDCGPEWGAGSVRNIIHKMRPQVEKQGWRIVSARPSGAYRLESM